MLKYRSPGPKYGVPNTLGYEKTDLRLPRAPAYSLGQLLQHEKFILAPGPKYDLKNITRHGTFKIDGGALSAFRPHNKIPFAPGPANYNIIPCMPFTKPEMPIYSIGMRRNNTKKLHVAPGPNQYNLPSSIGNQAPNLPSVPMYTMLGRSNEHGNKRKMFCMPGPAQYSAVQMDLVKRQMPRPVMLGRSDRSAGNRGLRTPAPNAYFPGPPLRYDNSPQFSIAGRIPQRADPYYTPADKVADWDM